MTEVFAKSLPLGDRFDEDDTSSQTLMVRHLIRSRISFPIVWSPLYQTQTLTCPATHFMISSSNRFLAAPSCHLASPP